MINSFLKLALVFCIYWVFHERSFNINLSIDHHPKIGVCIRKLDAHLVTIWLPLSKRSPYNGLSCLQLALPFSNILLKLSFIDFFPRYGLDPSPVHFAIQEFPCVCLPICPLSFPIPCDLILNEFPFDEASVWELEHSLPVFESLEPVSLIGEVGVGVVIGAEAMAKACLGIDAALVSVSLGFFWFHNE